MMFDRKILIIDDKEINHSYSSKLLIKQFSAEDKLLVDCFDTYQNLWVKKEGRLVPIKDLSSYKYVFIHDSYDNPMFLTEEKQNIQVLFDKDAIFVLFSGEKEESTSPCKQDGGYYTIKRSQFFNNFPVFLESFTYFTEENLDFLFNSNLKPKRRRLEQLAECVLKYSEVSIAYATASKEFVEMLDLCGYSASKEKVIRRILEDEIDFYEVLDELKS